MMTETILTIVFALLTACGAVFGYYVHVKNKVTNEALKAINSAEDLDAVGSEKFKVAVDSVYSIVPAVLKPFITKSTVEAIVQLTFNEVQKFAEKQ